MKRASYRIVGNVIGAFWMALFISWAGLSGCGTSTGKEVLTDSRVLEAWKRHEEVVARAIEGYQNDDEFIDACVFFERVTGIGIDVNMYTFGFIPQANAPKDLQRIRAWYEQNHSRLYWDEKSKTVQVRER